MYCSSCGMKCAEQSKFCHGCGAALPDTAPGVSSVLPSDPAHDDEAAAAQSRDDFTSTATPIPPALPNSEVAPEPVDVYPPPYVSSETEIEARQWWKSPGAIIAGATLLFAFLAWGTRDFWLGMDKTTIANSVSASNAVTSDNAVTQSYFVTRTAKLRDRATTVGSQIKGEAPRGTELKGSLIIGEDEKSQWLKVAETGYFISLANLATTAPLPLSITINKTVTVDEASQIRAEPADEAALIDTLSAGAKTDAIGVVNGWIEIGLKKGGVGYFKPSAASANIGLLTGKAVAVVPATVDFDALATISEGSCNFGGQMDRIFAAMNNASGKGPFAIAGVGQSLVATADSADPSPVTMAVKGTLKGLSVSGLFTSVDGSGFYFGDSVAAVGKAMSAFGYTASEDGSTYSNSEDGTGGFISRQGNRTALLCDN